MNTRAVVAEWLRRLTRNQFPSGSVGSNPTDCDKNFSHVFSLCVTMGSLSFLPWLMGIVGSVVECSPATRAARVRFPDDAVNFFLLFPRAQKWWALCSNVFDKNVLRGKEKFGDGGYRSPYLSHAKRALYHLSYVPMLHTDTLRQAYVASDTGR